MRTEPLYRLEPARLRPLQEWLVKYERAWNDRLDRVDDYLKEHDKVRRRQSELRQRGGLPKVTPRFTGNGLW